MLSLEGREIERVFIVDDDASARDNYAEFVEDAQLEAVVADGTYGKVEELLGQAKDANAQAIICDYHLSVGNYATFNGASAVAQWYQQSIPALLCTNFEKAQVDEMRKWRPQIPVLMRPNEFGSTSLVNGLQICLKELLGQFRTERKPFRSLIYVVDRDDKAMYVQVPSWYEPATAIDLLETAVPPEIWRSATAGHRFHAMVNIGATRMEELYFTDWEPQ